MKMLTIRGGWILRLAVVCTALAAWIAPSAARAQAAGGNAGAPNISVIITGARLIDGTGRPPIENSFLAFSGGRIVAVGPANTVPPPGKDSGFGAAQTIDAHGLTIMPTLISAHSHLGLVRGPESPTSANFTRDNVAHQLDQYEGYGVTAVLSLGLNQDILYKWRDDQRQGRFPGADIFTADRGIGVPGGAPPLLLDGSQVYRPSTTEGARADVREMAARHPEMLMLWLDDHFGTLPKMQPEISQAVLEEAHAAIDDAHAQGQRIAADVFYLDDAKALLQRGLDVVGESIRDQPVDAGFLSLMKSRNAMYIPALVLDESQFIYATHPAWMQQRFFTVAADPVSLGRWQSPEYAVRMKINRSTPRNEEAFAVAMQNVKLVHDAGIPIAMGTDSGALPTRVAGFDEHRELQLLVKAGLTPMEAIVAATRNSAQLLGALDERGTLEVGKRADFLILTANPLEDIRNTTKINAIWHGGKPVAPWVRFDDGLPTPTPTPVATPKPTPSPTPSPTPRTHRHTRRAT